MPEVDWFEGDAAAAFAEAQALGRPLFMYWGAQWCPPCNRIKSTTFARADFAELAGSFVALHIDGDAHGAQQLAAQYKLRSYPTLVVFAADGTEITRLPCELAGARFVRTLGLALRANYTVAQSLSAALSRERPLADDEWRLLSFYSWDTDEHQVLKNLDFAAALASMTRACTLPHAGQRLEWHALHAAAMGGKAGIDQRTVIARLGAALADPNTLAAQMDLVITYAVDLVRFLTEPGSAARTEFAQTWAAALEALESDATLDLTDRLSALRVRVRLSRLGAPIDGMAALARARVAAALAEVSDPALRHAVLNSGAGILADAGLLDEAEALLVAELGQSHSPYYFMHTLATISKKRGDAARAIDWYEQAWSGARGSATRLQWGATYLQGLMDFAPHDIARIELLSGQLMSELGHMVGPASQRNGTQLARIAEKLGVWTGRSERALALRQLALGLTEQAGQRNGR
jgi:thiol-disulfide isomerase/thioredoxin